jgi:hypothetical protein
MKAKGSEAARLHYFDAPATIEVELYCAHGLLRIPLYFAPFNIYIDIYYML